jgi:hypothetical protein
MAALPVARLTNLRLRLGYFRFSSVSQISLLPIFTLPGVLDGMEAFGAEAGARQPRRR